MRPNLQKIAMAAAGLGAMAPARLTLADMVSIGASQDATLLGGSDALTNNSLSDPGIFVGADGAGNPKRGLIEFDIAQSVPAGATITSATLQLTVGQVAGSGGGTGGFTTGGFTIDLFDETQPWGQPTNFVDATSFGGHGHGAPPDNGDATWNDAFYNSNPALATPWNASGGNWNSSQVPSGSTSVLGIAGNSFTWSSSQMASDVQNWLDNPSSNNGWLLRNEGENGTTDFRAFWSWQGAANNNAPATAPSLTITYIVSQPQSVWNIPGSGSWSDSSSWTVGVPNGAGITAAFLGAITSNATVSVTSPQTIGGMVFNNSSFSYRLAGTGPITISGQAFINVISGSHTIQTPLIYTAGLNVITAADPSIGNPSLTLPLAITATGAFDKFGPGTVAFSPSTGGITTLALPAVSITAGTMALGSNTINSNRTLLVTSSLSIAGSLDLGKNDMVVQAAGESGYGTINSQVASGRGVGALWTGTGITSSAAAASPSTTALAVVVNDTNQIPDGSLSGAAIFTTFDSLSVNDGDVLVKYTFVGDANLDGVIDANDYLLLDDNFNAGGALTGWYNGDFNYDGVINGDDYTLIDNAFNTQGSVSFASGSAGPAEMIASETEQIAGGSTAVPEPAMMGLLWIAGLLCRRRRFGAPLIRVSSE
jgi:hypothetical protein